MQFSTSIRTGTRATQAVRREAAQLPCIYEVFGEFGVTEAPAPLRWQINLIIIFIYTTWSTRTAGQQRRARAARRPAEPQRERRSAGTRLHSDGGAMRSMSARN